MSALEELIHQPRSRIPSPEHIDLIARVRGLMEELEDYQDGCCERCRGVPEEILQAWKKPVQVGPFVIVDGVVREPIGLYLSPIETRFFEKMLRSYPKVATHRMLSSGIKVDEAEKHYLQVTVRRLRQRLRTPENVACLPCPVEIVNELGNGYRLFFPEGLFG